MLCVKTKIGTSTVVFLEIVKVTKAFLITKHYPNLGLDDSVVGACPLTLNDRKLNIRRWSLDHTETKTLKPDDINHTVMLISDWKGA